VQPPEQNRCGYRQLALRFALLAGEVRFGFVQLLDDAAAGFEVVPASFCED